METTMEKTVEDALDKYNATAICGVCKDPVDKYQYPVHDICMELIDMEFVEFDADTYVKQIEKEFAGKYMPELDKQEREVYCSKCGQGWTNQPKICDCGNKTHWEIEIKKEKGV